MTDPKETPPGTPTEAGRRERRFALFVKPWKRMSPSDLGPHVRSLGFDLIELPVRPGFACPPDTIERDLPRVVRDLRSMGVEVLNVACSLPLDDERLYAACAEAGVGMNRVIFSRAGLGYLEAEDRARRTLDAALPLAERYAIRIVVQNHHGDRVPNHAMGLRRLLTGYDPRLVGAAWDPAHNALEGGEPEAALDMVADHLAIVNLKNAYWERSNGPEAATAEWRIHWTQGRHGRASWSRVARKLDAMGFTGPLCFSAEYSEEESVDRLIVEDLAYARGAFGPVR